MMLDNNINLSEIKCAKRKINCCLVQCKVIFHSVQFRILSKFSFEYVCLCLFHFISCTFRMNQLNQGETAKETRKTSTNDSTHTNSKREKDKTTKRKEKKTYISIESPKQNNNVSEWAIPIYMMDDKKCRSNVKQRSKFSVSDVQ